ncbi:hypothetical protein [Phytoactinopolyspora limicola]|uniref:hypothetical protein n=1 Tax=Phytoactinopolyspora limicola TaxID=2715536 RepID=UPI0014087594|nr:hypothetical protein [Phytoactinopolyspora limicola]
MTSSTILRLETIESPPSGQPLERGPAIRALLESVVRDTHHGAAPAGDRGRAGRPRRTRRQVARLGLATATASVLAIAALAVGGVLRPDGGVAQAATPPLLGHEVATGDPAGTMLSVLARQAATTPTVDGVDTTIRTERWSLAVTVGVLPGDGAAPEGAAPEGAAVESHGEGSASGVVGPPVTTAVIPVLREFTRHEDGAVSVHEVGGEPQFPTDAYRRAWDDAGRPGPHGSVVRSDTMPPGSYAFAFPADLPAEPDRLRELLESERPDAAHDAGALLLAVHELRHEQVLSGAVLAGVLDVLAAEPGVIELGRTTDRAGRTAIAVAADSEVSGWPVRQVLLLDPEDGLILGFEQVLTADVETVDVAAPAVIDYTTFQ